MKVAVVKETFPGERRVALVPADVAKLAKNGLGVILEPGAGAAAGFSDKAYDDRGGQLAVSRDGAFLADIVLHVRAAGFGHSSPGHPLRGSAPRDECLTRSVRRTKT